MTARRLNRYEYSRSVRDLLGMDLNPGADFPVDPYGYGFDNIGDILTVSPILMEKYLNAIASAPIPDKIHDYCRDSVAQFDWLERQGIPFERSFFAEAICSARNLTKAIQNERMTKIKKTITCIIISRSFKIIISTNCKL